MIGVLIDRMIAPLSPKWAAKRQLARIQLDALSTYSAGERNRGTTDWNPKNQSADASLSMGRELMLARAREACENNPYAASIRAATERHVVGTGLSPIPTARKLDGSEDVAFNESAALAFDDWADDHLVCDAEQRQSFWDLQRMAAGEGKEAGEHFWVVSYRRIPGQVGLMIQAFEPEQLDLTRTQADNGNEIRGGIEVNSYGAAVAYHFLRAHPHDNGFSSLVPRSSLGGVRIEAARVFHYFDQKRVRQTHGVTGLHAVLGRLRAANAYEEATLMQQRLQACIGLLINRTANVGPGGLNNPMGQDGRDGDGNREVNFQPGMVFEGNNGETVTPFAPMGAPGTYDPFMNRQLHAIGAGASVGYGQVSMDWTRGTYSGQRQELLELYAEIDVQQQRLVAKLCDPVYRLFIAFAVLEGVLIAPDFAQRFRNYTRAEWQGPERQWVDPQKEVNAIETEIALGINTRTRVLNRKGHRLRPTFAQLGEEKRLAEEAGIDVSGVKAKAATTSSGGNSNNEVGGDEGDEQDSAALVPSGATQ